MPTRGINFFPHTIEESRPVRPFEVSIHADGRMDQNGHMRTVAYLEIVGNGQLLGLGGASRLSPCCGCHAAASALPCARCSGLMTLSAAASWAA